MPHEMGRRAMLGVAGIAAAGALQGVAKAQSTQASFKIVAVNCSQREGKTTAEGLNLCLEGAREFNGAIETELVELGNLSIPAQLAVGMPLREGEVDDFPAVAAKLSGASVRGIIVGSPVYFGNMSALCKAFLDRCMLFRRGFQLENKIAGVLAVGGTRNGGQELTVQSIQVALSGQKVILTGTGNTTVRIGATLWNEGDSIEHDDFGMKTARELGRRVAELATQFSA